MMKTTPTLMIVVLGLATAQAQDNPDQDNREPSPRIPRSLKKNDRPSSEVNQPERGLLDSRSIDGSGNNIDNPLWGAAHQTVIRLFANAYADGTSAPAGENRPSARAISNAVSAQENSIPNERGASDFLWQWGQFLDHDIIETPAIDPAEPFNIIVPAGDPWFDPSGTGNQIIPLNRSLYQDVDGVREQVNAISAYIDASQVYGSDLARATALRRNDGSGKLATSESQHGDLLPYNLGGFDNAGFGPSFFLAGDVRANEQVGLTAMHTLFVREHNHWADQYAKENPDATDEDIYQYARMIVAAEMQAITYREFLPVLLGRDALPRYQGYRPNVRADIANEFAGAVFRMGHTLLSSTLLRLDENGDEIEAGNLSLAQAFFNPSHTENEGIAVTLRGLATQRCQELDEQLVNDVRNFLFGPPGSGGLDLASLNIQRGRDHGLPSYNDVRKGLGMRPIRRFSDINPNAAERLALVYTTPDDLDLWITGLCETKVPGSMCGPVYQRILIDQFVRLRDGDRFFYKHSLPKEMVTLVEQQTLATIIRRNTEIGDEIQDNVFLVRDATVSEPEPPRRSSRTRDRR